MIWRPPDAVWHARAARQEATGLAVVQLGAPVLRRRAEEVNQVDDDIRALVERMFATMYAADGQGLAAPQVDVSRRIAVADLRRRQTATAHADQQGKRQNPQTDRAVKSP